jgi:hypothetical protein
LCTAHGVTEFSARAGTAARARVNRYGRGLSPHVSTVGGAGCAALGADKKSTDHSRKQYRAPQKKAIWEGLMQNAITTAGLLRANDARHTRFTAPSMRAYLMLIGAAALSGAAMHMVRSTTAADLPDMSAQYQTRPTDLPHSAVDTSLEAVGL